jgi:DNA-binding transcriptional regulator YhcF (GntR family)
MDDESRPIFVQLAERLENDIISGALPEEGQIPSINEFAAFHRINPATALKGVNLLVDAGILYKKRGIGMFVATGARQRIRERRRGEFAEQYVRPLLIEAGRLGVEPSELKRMIDNRSRQ